MKRYILLTLMLLCVVLLRAQSPYVGGKGGAYASQISFMRIANFDSIGVEVMPTLLSRGASLQISAYDLHNKLDILIHDVYGRPLLRKTFWGVPSSFSTLIETGSWPAAVYWVEVRRDGRKFVQKIVVLAE